MKRRKWSFWLPEDLHGALKEVARQTSEIRDGKRVPMSQLVLACLFADQNIFREYARIRERERETKRKARNG